MHDHSTQHWTFHTPLDSLLLQQCQPPFLLSRQNLMRTHSQRTPDTMVFLQRFPSPTRVEGKLPA